MDVDVCPEPKDGGDRRCHNFMGQGGEAGVFYNNEIGQCTAEQVLCALLNRKDLTVLKRLRTAMPKIQDPDSTPTLRLRRPATE